MKKQKKRSLWLLREKMVKLKIVARSTGETLLREMMLGPAYQSIILLIKFALLTKSAFLVKTT